MDGIHCFEDHSLSFSALVLQKPSHNYKERDYICHLEYWLKLYKDEALDELLCVGCLIQSQLKHAPLAKRRAQTTLAYTKSEANTRATLELHYSC